MKTDTVYIFPDTMPRDELLFPLVQFFNQLVHLRPAKNDLNPEDELSGLGQKLFKQGQLRFESPASLANWDQERFARLVQDLQHRPAEYAAQLNNLALTRLNSSQIMEGKHSIINTILQQTSDNSNLWTEEREANEM
ncbi:MAG: hypothetical protein D3923_17310, partial [Candidatus Electrothrix sp. AR3]|nr:hypothetical protein [Candidatus Electrothrix sp. AR3]